MVEIELKAWLDDYESIKERLSSLGSYVRSYDKSDSYWLKGQDAACLVTTNTGIRVRRESGFGADGCGHESVLVTIKNKTMSGNIEVNDEREFAVSDAVAFEEMLQGLGLSKVLCKEKHGWEWSIQAELVGKPDIKAEVSMVQGLGWFLEIEILSDDGNERAIEESRRELFALLQKLGVGEDRIETRQYAEMLKGL